MPTTNPHLPNFNWQIQPNNRHIYLRELTPEGSIIDSIEIADLIKENHTEWLPRLLAIAHSKIAPLSWKGKKRGAIPGGAQAEDFVSQAIEKTITGTRCFAPADGSDIKGSLFFHLDSVIDSLISHACESAENRKVRNTLSEEDPLSGSVIEIPVTQTPLDRLIDSNDEERYQIFLLTFVDFIDDDPQLKEAFQLFYDGTTPIEVAQKMKLTIEQTYQLRRKIKRRIEAFEIERKKIVVERRSTS